MAAAEVHHRTPRALLKLRDRLDAIGPGEDVLTLHIEYEHECQLYGIDAGVPRGQLAAFIDASTIVLPREEHRNGHESDFVRWGRIGGRTTLRLYGRAWFSLLALRRWKRITALELEEARPLR